MGNITLKEYSKKLNDCYLIINNMVQELFNNSKQEFTFDKVKILNASFIDKQHITIFLELTNYNGLQTNRMVEINLIDDIIEQIIFNSGFGSCTIICEREKICDEVINGLFVIAKEYQNYFQNSINYKNIIANISKPLTDDLLEQITLDDDKLPSLEIETKILHK